jgi:hypothetical protein
MMCTADMKELVDIMFRICGGLEMNNLAFVSL